MPRIKNPLPEFTDGEVLRWVARRVELAARGGVAHQRFRRSIAARLRRIARRVPLWTDRGRAA